MEIYVKEILKSSDLSIVTKKNVRQQYREQVGRELTPEEKSRINDLVYEFVRDLAVEQKSNVQESPDSKSDSPGNKENVESKTRSQKFIIKGQVVDRVDLYKSKTRSTADKTPQDKKTVKQNGAVPEPVKTLSTREKREKFKNFQEKLKVSDVVKSVLESYDDSSSSISSVSSLSDSEADSEMDEKDEKLKEALEKLKVAREKKIQMSIEKKKEKKLQGGSAEKTRRSLNLGEGKKQAAKNDNDHHVAGEQNGKDKLQERLNSEKLDKDEKNKELTKRKNRVVEFKKNEIDSDSDVPEMKKSVEKSGKNKVKMKKKTLSKNVGKMKKNKILSDSEADEASDEKCSTTNLSHNQSFDFSDSDDETLDKIAAKEKQIGEQIGLSDDKTKTVDLKNSPHVVVAKYSGKDHCKVSDINKSDLTGKQPATKVQSSGTKLGSKNTGYGDKSCKTKKHHDKVEEIKKELIIVTESETSTGGTPDIPEKGEMEPDLGSDSGTGDTPLAKMVCKKSKTSKQTDENSDSDAGGAPCGKKVPNKSKTSKKVDQTSDSELSRCDTPVVKRVPDISKSKHKEKAGSSDNESSTDDIPLAKKKLSGTKRMDKNFDSEESEDDIPLARTKLKKNKNVKQDTKTDTDSDVEISQVKSHKKVRGEQKGKKKTAEIDSDSEDDENLSLKKKGKQRNPTDSKNSDKSDSKDKLTLAAKSGNQSKLNKDSDLNTDVISENSQAQSLENEQTEDSGNAMSDSDGEEVVQKGKKRPFILSSDSESPIKKKRKVSTGLIVSSESETSDEEKLVKKIGSSLDSDWDSDEWDVPLAKIKQLTKGIKLDELSSGENSRSQTPTGDQKKPAVKESLSLRLLRKICRECRLFVRNDRELKDCQTEEQKIAKCMELLRQAGMKGKPTLAKAEEVKLMKEARELSAENIISSETGRTMRKVKSIYARRQISPVKAARSPMKNPFKGLSDIIDSEGSQDE